MKGSNYYYCVWEVKTKKGWSGCLLMEFTDNAMKGREDGFREKRIGLILYSMIFLKTIGQFSEHAESYLDKMEFTIDMWAALSVQFSSVAQSCPTLGDPMNCSTPGLPVHHQLPEFTQTHSVSQ